jgi:DNA-directed RNA polymerase specialized sigma24 family protein
MDDKSESGNDAPRNLHDIVGGSDGGEGLDKQVEKMRWALQELRPSLPNNELPVAERMLDILAGHRSYSQAELAAEMGRSKGQVSKLWHGVAGKVADKIRSRK